jgi:NADPH-dependent 2,4-dienoyl-CoA reductase/sulfur reductase-like enzyme
LRELDVTIVAPEKIPLEMVFGENIGRLIYSLHDEKGIKLQLGTEVEKFEGKHIVESVILKNGERIETDMVLLGVGVRPNTGYLQGVDLHPDGSVKIDEYFQVAEDVYAAGDIVRFPDWRSSDGIRIEHWRTAEQHGRDAAHNMAGKKVSVSESVPFFWTRQVDINLRYVGHAKDWDEIIFDGNVFTKEFIAFYIKHNQVYAAASCRRDQDIGIIHELMRFKKMPSPDELRKGGIDWTELTKSL